MAAQEGGTSTQPVSALVRSTYLRLVQQTALTNGNDTLQVLRGLGSDDTVDLLQLLNRTPAELARIFEHDAEVTRAIEAVPQNHVVGTPRPEPGGTRGGSGSMDPMVLRALSVFERNVAMYVQRPDRVRELQAGLTAAQSEALMAALVDCYPLAVLHQGLERQKSGDAPLDIAAHILSPQTSQASESFNEAKVAELFRRLLGDFEAFKQTPHAYEGWLAGCSRRERKMIESLVSAFWDYKEWAPHAAGTVGLPAVPLHTAPFSAAARQHT